MLCLAQIVAVLNWNDSTTEENINPVFVSLSTVSPSRTDDSPPSSIRSSVDDVTSGLSRLTVPDQPRRRSATDAAKISENVSDRQKRQSLRNEGLQKSENTELRPRSQSDLIATISSHGGNKETRSNTLPINFYGSEFERSRPSSDRSSDTSLPFSDSCSESSGDSDHLTVGNPRSPNYRGITKRWSYDENQNERLRIAEERLLNGLMRSEEAAKRKKITKNPLDNVIHWVIEPPKQDQPATTHKDRVQTDSHHPTRPDPPKRGDSSKRINVQKIQEYREVTNLWCVDTQPDERRTRQ